LKGATGSDSTGTGFVVGSDASRTHDIDTANSDGRTTNETRPKTAIMFGYIKANYVL